MRVLLALDVLLLVAGIVSACLLWAGAGGAAAFALVFGGSALSLGIILATGQASRWGVPGDEPALHWHRPA